MRNESLIKISRSHYAFLRKLFCGIGSTNGASRSASTAVNAVIGIDDEFAVLFRDGADRAFIGASAASDAFIGNLISHGKYLLLCSGSESILRISYYSTIFLIRQEEKTNFFVKISGF